VPAAAPAAPSLAANIFARVLARRLLRRYRAAAAALEFDDFIPGANDFDFDTDDNEPLSPLGSLGLRTPSPVPQRP
jgi:hypothetical protein